MSSTIQDIGFEDEDILVAKSSNAADAKFDLIIGTIEDIIMETQFQEIQDQFMNKNYKHFEDSDENKLIYTTIHREYINLVEKYLENSLKKRIENFSMEEFMKDLMSRRNELDGEIFEILLTFEDFLEFKQLMLSFKSSKEGRSLDLSAGICIQSLQLDSSKPSTNSSRQIKSSNIKNNKSSQSTSTTSSSSSKSTNTPLLDKAQVDNQIDSDHD